jgi:hypothetical protein
MLERHNKIKWFCASGAIILCITGAAKIWSSFGHATFLTVADPIIGIKFGHLLLLIGVVEATIAMIFFIGGRQELFLKFVAWLSTNFVLYRMGLVLLKWHRPCQCMGNLTDALHISPITADEIMKWVLAYLLLGSYGTLFWLRQSNRDALSKAPTEGEFIAAA